VIESQQRQPHDDRHDDDTAVGGRGEKKFDVCFVGFLGDRDEPGFKNRVKYLDILFHEIPNSWLSVNVFHEHMAYRYAQARIGFNVSIKNDLNMRVFEVMSTGTALLTNRDAIGWKELGFEEDVHFIGYEGIEEMVEKAQWALEHPMEREKIAKAGHAKVRAEHTYAHRMAALLATCNVPLPEGVDTL